MLLLLLLEEKELTTTTTLEQKTQQKSFENELKDCVVVVKVDRRNDAPCSSQKDFEGLFFNAVSQKTDLFPFRRNYYYFFFSPKP